MILVWGSLTIWAICGISTGALLWHTLRRPTSTSDERFAAADDLITERERAARSRRQDRRRAL